MATTMTGSSLLPRLWRALRPLILIAGGAGAVISAALALELRPDQQSGAPAAGISYMEAPPTGQLTPQQALEAFHAGQARPIPGDRVDFGHSFDAFWLFMTVENTGEVAGTWHVATRWPFAPYLQISVQRSDGSVATVLESLYDSPFGDRPLAHRFLVSTPFALAPGERADLAIAFRAGGNSSLPLTVETAASLRSLLVEDAALSGAFYAFSLGAILFFAAFSIGGRSRTGLLYAVLFAVSLVLMAQIDGLAFQLLWPDWPVWNAYAALVLLLLVCAFGFHVAAVQRGSTVDSRQFRRAMTVMGLASLALIALVPVAPLSPLVIAAYVLLAAMFASHALATLPIVRRPGGVGRAGLVGSAVAAVIILAIAAMAMAGVPLPWLLIGNIHRIIYLFISMTTMLAITAFITQLRREHERALEREVDAARRDAELSRELLESEKNYARARELAAARQRLLASASHDIRQPLASLRLSLDALAADRNSAMRTRMTDAFDYLEGLTQSYMAEARDDETAEDLQSEGEPAAPVESFPLSLVTDTVGQMFRDEAVAKGLDFSSTGTERRIALPVLPLMRLVNNLVANAVKHTREGGVTVTGGETTDGLYLDVADTGPGMSAEALADLRLPGAKGAESSGSGLGLAIADDLAESLGLALEVDSQPGRGTRVRILIPAALGSC